MVGFDHLKIRCTVRWSFSLSFCLLNTNPSKIRGSFNIGNHTWQNFLHKLGGSSWEHSPSNWGDFPVFLVTSWTVRKSLSLERVTYLVLDEADRLADVETDGNTSECWECWWPGFAPRRMKTIVILASNHGDIFLGIQMKNLVFYKNPSRLEVRKKTNIMMISTRHHGCWLKISWILVTLYIFRSIFSLIDIDFAFPSLFLQPIAGWFVCWMRAHGFFWGPFRMLEEGFAGEVESISSQAIGWRLGKRLDGGRTVGTLWWTNVAMENGHL